MNGGATFFPDSPGDAVEDHPALEPRRQRYSHLLTGYQIEPYVQLGAGYQAFGGLGHYGFTAGTRTPASGSTSSSVTTCRWADLLSGNLAFMTRPGRSASDLLTPQEVETTGELRQRLLEADGSSVGTGSR